MPSIDQLALGGYKIFKGGELLTTIDNPRTATFEDAGAASQPGTYEYKIKVIYKYAGSPFDTVFSMAYALEIPGTDPDPGDEDPGVEDPEPGGETGYYRPAVFPA